MAKNNMDILLGNILGTAAISPDNKTVEQTPETKDTRDQVNSETGKTVSQGRT